MTLGEYWCHTYGSIRWNLSPVGNLVEFASNYEARRLLRHNSNLNINFVLRFPSLINCNWVLTGWQKFTWAESNFEMAKLCQTFVTIFKWKLWKTLVQQEKLVKKILRHKICSKYWTAARQICNKQPILHGTY